MKILFLFMFIPLISFCQKQAYHVPIDTNNGKITYSKIIILSDSVKADELYARCRSWFANTYNSSKSVIEMEDKTSGIIIGRALFTATARALGSELFNGYINYRISVFIKDNKYKYEITNFVHEGGYIGNGKAKDYGPCETFIECKGAFRKPCDHFLYQIDNNTISLVNGLKKAMETKVSSNSDW